MDKLATKSDDKKEIEEIRRIFSSLALMVPFAYPLIGWPITLTSRNNPLAAVNGVSIFINVEEWNKQTFKEKLFVALHEWMHIALMHSKRLRTRQHRMYNYACDFAINSMIVDDMKQFDMPPGLYDISYKNKSSEEIYRDLDEEVKKRKEAEIEPYCTYCRKKFDKDDYKDGSHLDPDIKKCPVCLRPNDNFDFDDKLKENLDREGAINQLMVEKFGAPWADDLLTMPEGADEQKILDEVIKAAARHKGSGRGMLPGRYEDHIEAIKKSKVPFERLLIRFAKECMKGSVDRNPFKPDPKYLPFDIFIPTERGTKIPKLVLVVDTSGSMDSVEFEYAAGHLQKLSSMVDKLLLITADTKVQEVIRVKNLKHEIKNNKVRFKGRGGTDMHEAFARADSLKPNLIILYSDLGIGTYPKRPKAPVIFLAREDWEKHNPRSPYGVHLTIKNITS